MSSNVLTFDKLPTTVKTRVLRVTGKAAPQVSSLEVGTAYTNLSKVQLSGGRFSAVLELTPGRNQFIFQPYAAGPSPLQSEIKVVYYEEQTMEAYSAPNSLDLHAAELGYERLPDERNVSFKKRLLQGSKGREDQRKHVPLAFATEIGFPYSRNMIRIKVNRTTYNRPSLTNGFLKVTPTELKYTGDQLVQAEGPVVFDAGYPYITPLEEVSPFGEIKLVREGGDLVSPRDYEYQPETGRIWLKNDELVGSDLLLVYNSVDALPLSGTIAALETALEALGHLQMEVTDSEFHASTDLSDWIIPEDWTPIPEREDYPAGSLRTNPGVYLSVSEVKAFPLHEHAQEYLVDGSGLGTKLERYVGEVNVVDHRTWDKIVVGRDGLRDENIVPLYDALPHLTDAKRGHWGTSKYNIHEVQYLGYGIYDPNNVFVGIIPMSWQSGTGHLGDLEADTAVQELSDPADVETEAAATSTNVLYGIL